MKTIIQKIVKNSENLSLNKHGENNLEFYDSDAEINKKCRYK